MPSDGEGEGEREGERERGEEWVVSGIEFSSTGREVGVWGSKKGGGREREGKMVILYVQLDELEYFQDRECEEGEEGAEGEGEEGEGEGAE